MKMNSWVITCILIVILPVVSPFATGEAAQKNPKPPSSSPVKIIFDTDMSVDCDDAGALAMLHVLADKGEAVILGICVCGVDIARYSAATVQAINSYYGRPTLPIAVGRGCPKKEYSPFTNLIKAEFPNQVGWDDTLEPAVSLYRKILTRQPDKSVTIVTLGMLNNISNLLDSKSDKYSQLSGVDLFKQKVKQLVIMAADFPKGKIQYNIGSDVNSAVNVMAKCPVPVVYSPAALGNNVKTGFALKRTPKNSPVRRIYQVFVTNWEKPAKRKRNMLVHGRPSWDQTAVLFAVRGTGDYYSISDFGKITIYPQKGTTIWSPARKGSHRYLIPRMPDQELAGIIDGLMSMPPKGSSNPE